MSQELLRKSLWLSRWFVLRAKNKTFKSFFLRNNMGNVALGIDAEEETIQTSITDDGWEEMYKLMRARIPQMGSASLADLLSKKPAANPREISVKTNPLEKYGNQKEPYDNNKSTRELDKDWICRR